MTDSVKRAVAVLNDALERDPEAITKLFNLRVECNDRLEGHPFVQVSLYGGTRKIGLLGLLNGMLGESPTGVIGARGSVDPETGRMVRITAFVDLRDEKVDYLA